MSHIRNYILIFWFLGGLAQELPSQNGAFFTFPNKDGFTFIDANYEFFTSDGIHFTRREHGYRLDEYRFRYVSSEYGPFFVSTGGGRVLEFRNDSLRRIDNSFEFKSRYGAFVFTKGDTIYSLGGSGQFNNQNNLIYFTPKLKEWLMEYRYSYRSDNNNLDFGQYDSTSDRVYFTLAEESPIKGMAHSEVLGAMPSRVYSYDFGSRSMEAIADLSSLLGTFFPNPTIPRLRAFHDYSYPLIYNGKELWTFDLSKGEAYRHTDADFSTLLQFEDILSYNPDTNDFLLAHNLSIDPHFLVIDESILLGHTYETYSLPKPDTFSWLWFLIGLPALAFVIVRKREINVFDQLSGVERSLRQRLSEEDYKVYELIKSAYPQGVEYPDLQSSFERELSYESRIKKLRTTIVTIDQTLQTLLGRRGRSVFSIEKGKEDKRVKVIRLVNEKDSRWVSVFKRNG